MKCATDEQRPIIRLPLFDLFVEQYQRDFQIENDHAFEIPRVLRGLCRMLFVHFKDKPVAYPFIPKHTIFVEDAEEGLQFLNDIDRPETDAYLQQVVHEGNYPEFRCVLLAYSKRSFFNGDRTIVENVPFICFKNVRVVMAEGKLEARVKYITVQKKMLLDVVCFTMPVESDEEEGIYEYSMLAIPEMNVKDRRVDGLNSTDYTYRHNTDGFLYDTEEMETDFRPAKETSREESTSVKKFLLDKPFRMSIRYMSEDVLKIEVDTLRG